MGKTLTDRLMEDIRRNLENCGLVHFDFSNLPEDTKESILFDIRESISETLVKRLWEHISLENIG